MHGSVSVERGSSPNPKISVVGATVAPVEVLRLWQDGRHTAAAPAACAEGSVLTLDGAAGPEKHQKKESQPSGLT